MSKKWLVGAGVAAAVFAGGAQATLLADGSFENVALGVGNYGPLLGNYGPGGSVGPAWTNGSNFVLAIDKTYSEVPLKFLAQAGNIAMDLTGAGNQGPVSLSQTVSLLAGSYLLSFYLGDISNSSNYNSSSEVKVLINNVQQPGTFVNSAGTSTTNWAQMLVPFTLLTGGPTTVAFSTAGLTLDNYTGIDNVVLTAVPEPGAWLMMLAGMAAVGFMAKRRSST